MKWLYFAGTATGDDNIGNIMILQFAVHVCFRCWLSVENEECMLALVVFQ